MLLDRKNTSLSLCAVPCSVLRLNYALIPTSLVSWHYLCHFFLNFNTYNVQPILIPF